MFLSALSIATPAAELSFTSPTATDTFKVGMTVSVGWTGETTETELVLRYLAYDQLTTIDTVTTSNQSYEWPVSSVRYYTEQNCV